MADRFYLPGPWSIGDEVELPEPEALHASKVLRLQAGDALEVFDGAGRTAEAALTSTSKRGARVQIHSVQEPAVVLQRYITIAFAPPKGDRFKWLLEKLTELGVQRFIPLRTERSVVDPRESKLEKLEQHLISACKQCRRNQLPELTDVYDLDRLLDRFPGDQIVVGDPQGATWAQCAPLITRLPAVTAVIGPEGGFSETELTRLQERGGQLVCISSNVLRIETAAIGLGTLLINTPT